MHWLLGKISRVETRYLANPVRAIAETSLLNVFTGKIGTQVVAPYRDEDESRHLKLMGDLGQIVRMVRAPTFVYRVSFGV
jgi:hypothetical protein